MSLDDAVAAVVGDEPLDQRTDTGPDAALIAELMGEFVESLRGGSSIPAMIAAAMAHLNLAMIHPFRDGNGRMARCLQTLVLARGGILAAPFSSIGEYLGSGANTGAYYRVLADVGAGSWNPRRDARPWVRFVLTAHYRQARTMVYRTEEAERRWEVLSVEVRARRLPERSAPASFNASMGLRLRNPTYRELADVSETIAGRDLKALVTGGLLEAVGERRGRSYRATPDLIALDRTVRTTRTAIEDPFQTLGSTPRSAL